MLKQRDSRQAMEFYGLLTGHPTPNDCKTLGKQPAKRRQNEASEQSALFSWARHNEGRHPALRLMFAIPNGGSRAGGKIEGAHLKAQGVRAGVPDVFIAAPIGCFHGLFIELKAEGGRVQENQREWLTALSAAGYRAIVCYGFEQAKNEIEQYLTGYAQNQRG
ncbi:MAG: VRR-NUC domain-containing protein [Oscillospiraceae bacterium]|nr:VRR-NUC domain-containing protein [Oscillospiraceae bacterium]